MVAALLARQQLLLAAAAEALTQTLKAALAPTQPAAQALRLPGILAGMELLQFPSQQVQFLLLGLLAAEQLLLVWRGQEETPMLFQVVVGLVEDLMPLAPLKLGLPAELQLLTAPPPILAPLL